MGPETGCRTFDKLDFILFPLVLLLWVSLRFSALLKHLSWPLHCFYDYIFNQALPRGVHHKALPTISFLSSSSVDACLCARADALDSSSFALTDGSGGRAAATRQVALREHYNNNGE